MNTDLQCKIWFHFHSMQSLFIPEMYSVINFTVVCTFFRGSLMNELVFMNLSLSVY